MVGATYGSCKVQKPELNADCVYFLRWQEREDYSLLSPSSSSYINPTLHTNVYAYKHSPQSLTVKMQYLEKIMEGYRLPPPPGCSRAVYDIMIQCW